MAPSRGLWRTALGGRVSLTGVGAGGFAVRPHAILPPVAVEDTCLSLRVLRLAAQDLAALMAAGAIAIPGRRIGC